MIILITGGAGFIGSKVLEQLINKGNTLYCVDNFNDYYDPAIKRRNIEALRDHPQFHLIEEDICDYERLDYVFREGDIEVIVHLAARAGVRPSIENPLLYHCNYDKGK